MTCSAQWKVEFLFSFDFWYQFFFCLSLSLSLSDFFFFLSVPSSSSFSISDYPGFRLAGISFYFICLILFFFFFGRNPIFFYVYIYIYIYKYKFFFFGRDYGTREMVAMAADGDRWRPMAANGAIYLDVVVVPHSTRLAANYRQSITDWQSSNNAEINQHWDHHEKRSGRSENSIGGWWPLEPLSDATTPSDATAPSDATGHLHRRIALLHRDVIKRVSYCWLLIAIITIGYINLV